jgi:hypothetical protein
MIDKRPEPNRYKSNPNAYLTDVLTRFAGKRDGEPIGDLLPGNWVNTNSHGDMFEYITNAMAA